MLSVLNYILDSLHNLGCCVVPINVRSSFYHFDRQVYNSTFFIPLADYYAKLADGAQLILNFVVFNNGSKVNLLLPRKLDFDKNYSFVT